MSREHIWHKPPSAEAGYSAISNSIQVKVDLGVLSPRDRVDLMKRLMDETGFTSALYTAMPLPEKATDLERHIAGEAHEAFCGAVNAAWQKATEKFLKIVPGR